MTDVVPVRWVNTHGEQCHVKMLYVEQMNGSATLLLGSGNYTRRNMENFNAECDLALTAPQNDPAMQKARRTFDDWWSNADGREYVVAYQKVADPSNWRKFSAWWLEATGMGTF